MDQATRDALTALEKFVVENDDLLELESHIGRFNIFDALRIVRTEIRHSNFLAFILDPVESHGQSQLFLKAMLMDLLKVAPVNLRPFSPIEIDGTDLRGVSVRREWQNIDLVIASEQPPFVVAIENKIDSKEHSNQLSKYQTTIQQNYPHSKPFFVFLTPHGEEASEEEWVSYSYTDIHRVLTRVRNAYSNAIGDDVLAFLDHYLNLIGTRFMDDPKIDELCQRIFNNHRQALELIFERAGSPTSGLLGDVEAAIREDDRWHTFYRKGALVDFVPRAWLDWLPPLGVDNKEHPQSWFVFRFLAKDVRLGFYAEIRRMSNPLLRRPVLDVLLREGSRFGLKPSNNSKPGDSYKRISQFELVAHWADDELPDEGIIRAAVKKKLDDLYPKLSGLPELIRQTLQDATAG